MSGRARAAAVIGARQVIESLLTPGLYVMLSLALGLGCLLVAGFAASIDTSGFNPALTPLYDFIGRSVSGAFGTGFQEKLLGEGPLAFALVVSYVPMLAYLAVASVFRFGQEKSAGAVELLTYGPADGTSYALAAFLKDAVLSAACLAVMGVVLLAAAAFTHVAVGALFPWSLLVLFFLSLAVLSYGSLCSVLSSHATSALALFIGIQAVYLLLLAGSFAIVSAPVRTLSTVAAAALQWISPWFYAALCYRGVEAGSTGLAAAAAGLLALLAAAVLFAGHLGMERRGVKA